MLSFKLKIILLISVIAFLAVGVIVWQKYPFGAKQLFALIITGIAAFLFVIVKKPNEFFHHHNPQ